VKGGFLLDVVVGESPSILELLPSEDQALLVRGNALLVLDLRLDIVNRVGGLDLKGDCLPREGLDEDLHPSTETQNEMEGGLLLNVVVRKGATVLELLSGKDKTLLVGGDTLLVLDLRLHVVDGVRGLNIEGDCLPSESLDEDLHTATETEDKVEGGLLLDVVVRKGAPILKLLASEDEALLVRGNTVRHISGHPLEIGALHSPFLVLNLGLHVIDGVGRLHLEGDCLSSEGLDKDLHAVE